MLIICFKINVQLREHPFNLKAMVFIGVKIIFFASQHRIFLQQVVVTLFFFLQKQQIRHEVLTEFFFLPISETEKHFQANLQTEFFFSQKNHSPLPPS